MNDRNYPLLTRLFLELQIELHPTSMSFSVDTENISWCSEDFKRFRFFNSIKKIRIFLEMVRFNNTAPTATHFTVGEDGEVNAINQGYIAYLFGD